MQAVPVGDVGRGMGLPPNRWPWACVARATRKPSHHAMNDKLRSELERLKERQVELNQAVDLLGVHIAALEKRVVKAESATPINPAPVVPMAIPPLLQTIEAGIIESSVAEAMEDRHPTANLQLPPEPVV